MKGREKDIICGTGEWDKNDIYRHTAFEKDYKRELEWEEEAWNI